MCITDLCVCSVCSTLIRKLGGFFIRRKMDETVDGKKDILYRSLLHVVSVNVPDAQSGLLYSLSFFTCTFRFNIIWDTQEFHLLSYRL